jgi:diaminohydroxyphosphoribosylaminopyrimidine deaminase/5-amino-6-(5-phosphoribosylamino)uracil reductase
MVFVDVPVAKEVLGSLDALGQGTERVHVHAVLGLRADGVVGCGSHRMIINSLGGLRLLHALRAKHDAVVVGSGTCRVDNPQLTVRAVRGDDPVPVVLASHLDIAPESILAQRGALVLCGPDVDPATRPDLASTVLPVGTDGRLDLEAVVAELGRRGLHRVLVEGGPTVVEAFACAGLLDAILLILNPTVGTPVDGEVRFDLAESAVRSLPEQFRMRVDDDIAIVLANGGSFPSGAAA